MNDISIEDTIFQSDVETDKIFHIAEGEFTIRRSAPNYQDGFSIPFYVPEGQTGLLLERYGYFETYWRIKGTGAWQQGSRISGSATYGNGIGLYTVMSPEYRTAQLYAWIDTTVITDNNIRTIEWRSIIFDSNENNGPVRVSTSTDTDVQWSSFYDYRKIHKKGSVPISISDSAQIKTVSHTLGYRPVVKAWFVHSFVPFPGFPPVNNVYTARDYFIKTAVFNDRVEFTVDPNRMGGAIASGNIEYRIYHNE